MRRAGISSLLVACAVAGALAAVVLAPTGPAATGTTATTATTGTTGTTDTTPSVIPAGVTIGGIGVGGLSPQAAAAVVRTGFASPLALVYARHMLTATPADFAATAYVDRAVSRALASPPNTAVPLTVTVSTPRIRAYVAKLAKRFDRAPVDSRLFLRRLKPWISVHKDGRALDRTHAVNEIAAALRENLRLPIDLRMKRVRATVTRKSFGGVIVIRRSSNALHLYDGMRLRRTFRVATGERRYPTPLGRFRIVVKWKNPWWYPPDSDWAKDEKPIPPGPDNPLGTRWMGISSPGVGIHGTPNPGSIGYSVSHGCIRMRISDAEWLFENVAVGTPVFIVAA